MINFIFEYWYVLVTVAAIFGVGGYHLHKFVQKPSNEKIEAVKKWLVYACIEAEHMWGSGTGKIKILEVYNAFLSKYPAMANVISYDTFADWVKSALEEAQHIMTTNEKVKAYVED